MVNYLTRLVIADNTGIRQVQCITLLGKTRSNVTKIGNLIVMVAKRLFSWSQFKKGVILRGLVVRTCLRFYRGAGVWVRFGQNAAIVVNKKKSPVAKRLKGPFMKEMCIKYNLLGTVSRFLV